MREIVSNLLAHRDFSNAYVAKMIIEKDQVLVENANRSHGYGNLNLQAFSPYPKNPVISSVFREIGLADELGSGMKNTYKYTSLYSGGQPQFVEGDVFKTIIPLNAVATVTVGPEQSRAIQTEPSAMVNENIGEKPIIIKMDAKKVNELVAFCAVERTKAEMMEFCGIKSDSYFRMNVLKPLVQIGLLERTIPDKPRSPKQRYVKA